MRLDFRALAIFSRWLVCLTIVASLAAWARAEDQPKTATPGSTGSPAATPSTSAAASPAAAAKPDDDDHQTLPRPGRVVLLIAKNCPKCDAALAKLQQPGGDFEKLRAAGWTIGTQPTNHVQILDKDDAPDLVKKLNPTEYPIVAGLEGNEVARSFKSGCTTPLDAWTIGFLATGVNLRPPGVVLEAAQVLTTGSYRLRGNHWSVEGDWNPTRDKVLQHLRGPNHYWQLEAQWHIDYWSLEELRSLHDDLHERYDTAMASPAPQPVKSFKN